MDNGTIVRPAELNELDAAADLRAEMASESNHDWDREHPGWRSRFAEFFREKQRRGDAQVFYALLDGKIVGMAAFSVLDEYRAMAFGKPRGFVNSVYVIPSMRRRGIAREMMIAGLAWLKRRGCVMVRLRTSYEGRPLYRELGFVAGTEMELEF